MSIDPNLTMRRAIRAHIEEAAEARGFSLQQHTIENLVYKRVQEVGEQMATGELQKVDWESVVMEAHRAEELSKRQLGQVADKLPEDWREDS